MRLLDGSSGANQQNARILAKWIGEARQRFPILTNAHENEIYDWLLSAEGYGRAKGQMKKETEFLQRLGNILQKKGAGGMFNSFDASKPLNIKNLQYKPQIERDYDEQLHNLEKEIKDLEKELQAKTTDLLTRGGTTEQVTKITEGMTATLIRKKRAYIDMLEAKGKMLEASKAQTSLFVNGIRGIQRQSLNKNKDLKAKGSNGKRLTLFCGVNYQERRVPDSSQLKCEAAANTYAWAFTFEV